MKYIFVYSILIMRSVSSTVFHEGSSLVLSPGQSADYFGYSVLLRASSPIQLIVGAPKARSQELATNPGAVFTCSLARIPDVHSNITCTAIKFTVEREDHRYSRIRDYFKDDMWLGASIAAVNNGSLLVTAPRWSTPYKEKHLLANGLCYVISKNNENILLPLNNMAQLAFLTDGKRKEYGDYGTVLNFYAYGQAGMSIKVTDDQKTLILGAPGLLHWTGGIINYKLLASDQDYNYFSKQPTTNPYFTRELGPDDYFGYSVDAGIFELSGDTLFIAGAPRSRSGYGQVLIFEPSDRELKPLNIRASLTGPQLGSYFGSSLCSVDLDGDGRSDLLVGAPNYVNKGGSFPFDQGAVFVYLTTANGTNFLMTPVGMVMGTGASTSRFGTSIASLGDVDGDGYSDVAIGAPWESGGAVYIYRGTKQGLNSQYIQRIAMAGASGFGIAISKGLDIDNNGCNDLAVGAHKSAKAYMFRCVPTIRVRTSIQVPDAMDLPQNSTNFTAEFCVHIAKAKYWPRVKLILKATIAVDVEEGRASLAGDAQYNVVATPGEDICDEQVIDVNPRADLSKPITMLFKVEYINDTNAEIDSRFPHGTARLSEDCVLTSSFDIQLTRDCGEDLICHPLLDLTLSPLSSSPFIPGLTEKLGVKVKVVNLEEPAYGFKVNLYLPSTPVRVPGACALRGLNMSCDLPAPLPRGEAVHWSIELEYTQNSTDELEMPFEATLSEPLEIGYNRTDSLKRLTLIVSPKANITLEGKSISNATIPVSRKMLYDGSYVSFVHFFEITNHGPSDWQHLETEMIIPNKVALQNIIEGCKESSGQIECSRSIAANVSLPIVLQYKFNLSHYGKLLRERGVLNLTTSVLVVQRNLSSVVTTTLVLEPAPPLWPIIVGVVFGFVFLSAITYVLYKRGFFSRERHEELKRLKRDSNSNPDAAEPQCSETRPCSETIDESTQELLVEEDSD